jgi:hypothetical protein
MSPCSVLVRCDGAAHRAWPTSRGERARNDCRRTVSYTPCAETRMACGASRISHRLARTCGGTAAGPPLEASTDGEETTARYRAKDAYCARGTGRGCGCGCGYGVPPPPGTAMYGATTTGIDELGASSAGVAMGCASTIGCRESGAVCSTVPLLPSLIPLCESSITGLRALSLDAAKVAGTAKPVVSEVATAMATTDWSKRTGGMGGPVRFENAGLHRKRFTLPRR